MYYLCTRIIEEALMYGLHSAFRFEIPSGEMVEWSITAVLKTAVPRGTGGSNPSLSAQSTLKLNSEEIKEKRKYRNFNELRYFFLYIIILPEYVESTQILPKDSPMATIWLHFFLQNKNCSQEIVESSRRSLRFKVLYKLFRTSPFSFMLFFFLDSRKIRLCTFASSS